MPIDFDNAFGVHGQALAVRSHRAGLLAANLANADTPGYKARDIDFRAVLEGARTSERWAGMRTTNARHIKPVAAHPPGMEPDYRVPLQPAVDGNTVDTQMEQAAVMDNAVRYQATLTFLNGRIRGIQSALRGE